MEDPGATIPLKRPTHPLPSAGLAPSPAESTSAGNYVFGAEIARGGMGSILEARDCMLERTVAVKIMLAELDVDEQRNQRFINEAKVLGHLEHPNIVPVHDLGRDTEGQLYYTMKLIKGRTLQAIIDDLRNGAPGAALHYTVDRLLTIFRKVCDAMAFAHSRGIIHRDLKPENLMVGEFGEALVMDWGLAKSLSDELQKTSDEKGAQEAHPASFEIRHSSIAATLDGSVMGTPQYMSPEQAEGRVADIEARSDIFSLGGILYAILTLRPPVEGKTLAEVLEKVASGSIISPSAFGATATKAQSQLKGEVLEARKVTPLPHCPGGRVPAGLSAVTMKALSLAREDRYENVGALVADIEAYQGGFATTAEHAGAAKLFILFIKRHRGVSLAALLILMLSAAFTVKVVTEGHRAEQALAELHSQAPAFATMAESYRDQLRMDAALASIESAIKLAPTQPSYHVLRGQLLQTLGRFGASLAELNNAESLGQHDPPTEAARQLSSEFASISGELPLRDLGRLHVLLLEEKRFAEASFVAPAMKDRGDAMINTVVGRLKESIHDVPAGQIRSLFQAAPGGMIDVDLNIIGKQIPSLDLLRGLPMRNFICTSFMGADISPLKGMRLEKLHLAGAVSDLRPLAGAPLREVELNNARIVSLEGLEDAPLEKLLIQGTQVKSLEPLRKAPLHELDVRGTPVSDLAPLAGKSLEMLHLGRTAVRSLAPLKGMPLQNLSIALTAVTDLSPLSDSPLEILDVSTTHNTDIQPLPFRTLRKLSLNACHLTSIEPLRDSSLEYLNLRSNEELINFRPLGSLKLRGLDLQRTKFSDGHLLAGQPLEVLLLTECKSLLDFSFLDQLPKLRALALPAAQVEKARHLTQLRFLTTVELYTAGFVTLGETSPRMMTTDEFWKEHDKATDGAK